MNDAEIFDAIRLAIREATLELIDNIEQAPQHRDDLVDTFARVLLESVTSHAEHLVKRSAVQLGVNVFEH